VSGWRWYMKMVPPRAFSGATLPIRAIEDRRPLRIGRPSARAPPAYGKPHGRAQHDRVFSGFPRPSIRQMGQQRALLARGEPSSENDYGQESRYDYKDYAGSRSMQGVHWPR
jgi:hypothetical protein